MHPDSFTLTARWLFPVDRPPLEGGTITIAADRIVAIEPHGVRTADTDLGIAAIVPGFVNAHTHLDLSGLRGKCPPTSDFTDWLRAVIRHRRTQTIEHTLGDIVVGYNESLIFGTTLLGDIGAAGLTATILAYSPMRLVAFYEVLGLPIAKAKESWAAVLGRLQQHRASPTCRSGLSPHAPYSTSASIIRAAAWNGHVMTIHLAETQAELELLSRKSGPFVAFLEELGVWAPEGLAPSAEWILRRTQRAAVLFAHGNYLRPDAPIPPNGTIVYCPRTHAAFGHPPHPFREFLARGVRVALGTDSLASNPDLDLWAEACFVHQRHPDVPGETLLRMATLSGAEALGWAEETGSLTPGKSADLVVLPLGQHNRNDPHELILEAPLAAERRTMFRGSWRRSPEASLD